MILKEVAQRLLDNFNDPEEAQQAIIEIQQYFSGLTAISGEDENFERNVTLQTSTGMALSINHAAQCLSDYRRTAKLLKGVVSAIRQKQKEHPGETIRIFYAGCGPYAPFMSIVAPLFSPEEVQFSLLEVHPESYSVALQLIKDLGFQNYLLDSYQADATTFEIPDAESYHILFSETLDALLYREAYVPILLNLIPQLNAEAIVIPENVRITVSLAKGIAGVGDERYLADEESPKEVLNVRELVENLKGEELPTEIKCGWVSVEPIGTYAGFVMDTAVHIYKDIELQRGESSLTIPLNMPIAEGATQTRLMFRYELKPQVELKLDFT